MPTAMTGLWLGVGGAMIAGFLLVAAFLPLSHPEYSLLPIKPVGSGERNASRYAMRSDKAGRGDGRGGGQGQADNAKDGGGGKGQAGGKASGQSGKPESQGGDKPGGQGKSDQQSKTGDPSKNAAGEKKSDRSDDSRQSYQPPATGFAAIANAVKWIALVILALVVAVVAVWFAARHLASVSESARKLFEALSAFWRSLFRVPAPEPEESRMCRGSRTP